MTVASQLRLRLYEGKVIGARLLETVSPVSVGSVCAARTKRPHFAITFDDGPTPERTPQILRALADGGSTATFFVLMGNVRRYPGLLREVMAEGHEIGLHGWDHVRHDQQTPDQLVDNLTRAVRELQDVTGRPVVWYRPPYGFQTPRTHRMIYRCGLRTVLWNRSSWDYREVPQETRVSAACYQARAGNVILAHDGHAGPEEGALPSEEPTLDRYRLVSDILARYRSAGLTSTTCSDLLNSAEPVFRIHYNPPALSHLIAGTAGGQP